jgi:acetyl esterase
MVTAIAVMGDSAGGTLAAVVALRARDENGPRIRLKVMVYPVLDHDYETGSYRQFGSQWGVVTRTDMIWFHSNYVSHPDQWTCRTCLRSDAPTSQVCRGR